MHISMTISLLTFSGLPLNAPLYNLVTSCFAPTKTKKCTPVANGIQDP